MRDEAGAALAYQTVISFLDGALLEWSRQTYAAGKGWERISRTVDPETSAHGGGRTARRPARLGRGLLDRIRAAHAGARGATRDGLIGEPR